MEAFVLEWPAWLNLDVILRVIDSKVFSAISWIASAIVATVGLIAKIKYRRSNLKKLLDEYIEKAVAGEGRERDTVKEVVGRAIRKRRGQDVDPFKPYDVFEDAARMFAQNQPDAAIEALLIEAGACEATIDHAQHRVRLARERAATAYLEVGLMRRHLGRAPEAIDAFRAMLRVNEGDLDALRMLGIQYRDMQLFTDAEQNFTALEYHVRGDQAAVADVKRELGAVHLGSGALPRAEEVLNEAMEIEKSIPNQRGVALTYAAIGAVQTARGRWRSARRSYIYSRTIHSSLGDSEGVRHVSQLLKLMEEKRAEVLRQRRQERRQRQTPDHRRPPDQHPPVLH